MDEVSARLFLDWSRETLPVAGLVASRLLGAITVAPGWSVSGFSWRKRLHDTCLLVIVITPVVRDSLPPAPHSPVAYAGLAMAELGIGLALGFAASLVIASSRAAGELIALQAGLAPAGLLDPDAANAGVETSALGPLFGWLALAVFLTLDGPLHMVDAVAESYAAIPVRSAGDLLRELDLAAVVGRVGWATGLAVQAAAPVAVGLVITSLALGILARAAPGVADLAASHLVRISVGVLLVLVGLGGFASFLHATWLVK
jgi:flagellar biosynthetic protein FliR